MKTKVLQEQQTSQLQLRGTLSQVKFPFTLKLKRPFPCMPFKVFKWSTAVDGVLGADWPKKIQQKLFVAQQNADGAVVQRGNGQNGKYLSVFFSDVL